MWRLVGMLMLACFSFTAHATTDDTNNDNNLNSSDTNQNNTNNKNAQLSADIKKMTEKALKVFKNLTKDPNASKEAFFANVGENPTAAEFEGGDESDVVTQTKFKIAGDDS